MKYLLPVLLALSLTSCDTGVDKMRELHNIDPELARMQLQMEPWNTAAFAFFILCFGIALGGVTITRHTKKSDC